VAVGEGSQTIDLALELSPPGVIYGKVVDDAGDPVTQAVVELFGSGIVDGRRKLTRQAVQQTSDGGEYRFTSLAEGNYYLSVSGYPWFTKFIATHGDAPARSITHSGYGMRYYPNVGDAAAASPLVLKPGQDAEANFTMLASPAVSVQVRVEGGENLSKQFSLTTVGIAGSEVLARQGKESGDLYNFWGVAPGRYTLRVEASDSRRTWYARQVIDAGATDIEIGASLEEAPSLTGTVSVDGGAAGNGLAIVLKSAETGMAVSSPVAGGKFSIPAMPPDHYQVALAGADDMYLKTWSVEGGYREGDTLEIPAGAQARLKISAAGGAARISGTVTRHEHPLAGALVVLSPGGRAVEADSDGGYEFRGLPPGAYDLFAVEDGADLEYADLSAIQPYLAHAKKVRVAAGEAHTERLDLSPAPAHP
jgi:hypothetical protein